MYEAVYASPEGESTAARHAATAAESGYEGVVVRNWPDADAPGDTAEYADEIRDRFGVDVVTAVEIDADSPESASGHVGNARPKYDLVLVRGGSPAINRFAVESPRVDALVDPMRAEGDVNHVLGKAAAENGVAVEFSLAGVIRETGGPRVRALQGLRKLREVLADADAPHVVSATPRSHLQQRAPRELVAVGEAVGFSGDAVEAGLEAWGDLAARNRRRQSDSFIGPGVERGRYEEDA